MRTHKKSWKLLIVASLLSPSISGVLINLSSCGYQCLPTHFLNISNNVLYGITCKWDDPQIKKYNVLQIPGNIVSIADNAFYNIGKQIHTIKFCESDDTINTQLYIGKSAFSSCSNVKKIILPSRLSYVDDEAFQACSSVQTLDISSWDKRNFITDNPFLGLNIFRGWSISNKTKLILNKNQQLNSDIYFTFKDAGLPTSWLGGDIQTKRWVKNNFIFESTSAFGSNDVHLIGINDKALIPTSGEIIIPKNVTLIRQFAFANVFVIPKLKEETNISITFEDGSCLKKICLGAFLNCSNITTVDLSNCNDLDSIGPFAFNGCNLSTNKNCKTSSSTEAIYFPKNLTSLGLACLANNENLKTLNFSETKVNKMPPFMCYNDILLEHFRWSALVKPIDSTIPTASFYGVKSWRTTDDVCCVANTNYEIMIPSWANIISDYAFSCSSLQNLIIEQSKSNQTIKSNSFANCEQLQSITFSETTQYIESDAFKNIPSIRNIDVSCFKIIPSGWSPNVFSNNLPENVTIKYHIQTTTKQEWKEHFVSCGVSEDVVKWWNFIGDN